MRLVRSRAQEWGLDPNRIGIMGFSAGGEVVSWVTYTQNFGDPNAADPIDPQSARPIS
jgi:acetyl esterase/lipase